MRDKFTFRLTLPLLLGMLLIPFATAAWASPVLTPHTAEYKVKISVLGGKLRTRIEATDDGYRAESSIRASGMSRIITRGAILESSVFSATDDGVVPIRYKSSDSISSDGQEVELDFDWDAGEVTGIIDGADFQTDINGALHDRVSLQYGLMHDLLNGIERPDYSLQDAEKFKQLSITNIGSKPVKVPFGRFEAIGIQHQAANSSRITTLWCVAELGYLPVIIEQHRKGKLRLRAVLTKYLPLVESVAEPATAQ